jgi:hypothetical protein
VVSFICDILHRFGFPNTIITNLGSNFHSHQFWDFYERSVIEVKYVSVAHLRANGQVECANGLILDGLKKRLYDENSKKGGKWINEISSVIWGASHTTKQSHRTVTFLSRVWVETILPADVMWQSPRLEIYEEGEADDARHLKLDSTEEVRCNVLLRSACYLQGVRRYHDRNVQ